MGEVVDGKFTAKMGPEVCFLLETPALGAHRYLTDGHMELVEAFMETPHQVCYQFKIGLSPDLAYFSISPKASRKDMQI